MSPPYVWARESGETHTYYPWSSSTVAFSAQAINRSSVAALSFLVWDILITFDDEVQLIWPQSWSYTKYMYFVARYQAVLSQIPLLLLGSELSPHFHFNLTQCYHWRIFQGLTTSIIILTVDFILMTRVRALYNANHIACYIVHLFFGIEILGMIVSLALSLRGIVYDNMCAILSIPLAFSIYGLGTITFQVVVFGLTLYKFVRFLRDGFGRVPLVVLLIRDGTWAFVLLFFVYACLVAVHVHLMLAQILYPWILTFCSFCGYRILLNLRRFTEDGSRNRIANIRSIAVTTIRTTGS